MKNGVQVIAGFISVCWFIVSIPFILTLWFLGGDSPLQYFADMLKDIFDE